MPDYKMTWLFEAMQANPGRTASSVIGWSETWYLANGGSIDQAGVIGTSRAPRSFLRQRADALHALYWIKWLRVSDVANPRLSKVFPISPAMGGGIGVPAEAQGGRLILITGDTTAAQINCAVEIDFSKLPGPAGDIVHHRRFLLRGLPRSIINGNILNEQGAGWEGVVSFANFMGRRQAPNAAGNGDAPVYSLQYEPHPVADSPIETLIINPNNPRQIILTAPLGPLNQNAKILVRNTAGIGGVNRIWTVQRTAAAPPYTLAKSRGNLAGTWVANSGTARRLTYLYGPADEYLIVGLKMKKVGSGGFGRTRGRRRAG